MSSFYGGGGSGGGGGGPGMPGPPGRGIKATAIDANGNLVITYTDSTSQAIGKIIGPNGAVFTPVITGSILSWTNNGGLVNPAPVDLATIVINEGESWEDMKASSASKMLNSDFVWGSM